MDNRFLFYWLKHPDFLKYVEAESHGLNMPRLGTSTGKTAPFVLAPRKEQTRIADQLDTLLARINACKDRLEAIPVLLKRFRQAVLEFALSGDLTAEWREEASSSFEEWSPKLLGDIAEIGTGSTPLRSNSSYFAESGTPWVTSAATGRPYVDAAQEFVTPAAISAHRLKVFAPGTLLIAMYGEGKTRGQVTELRIHATINQACAAVTVDQAQADVAFVKLALWVQYEQMRALAEGGNQPNLNLSKVKSIPIRLPPSREQTEIVNRVETLLQVANGIDARYTTMRALAERLVPQVLVKGFRGELVPQDPNDEPARDLLARISAERVTLPTRKQKPRRSELKSVPDRPLLNVIAQMDKAEFTFEELHAATPLGYESLKEELFALLSDTKSGVEQYFDGTAKSMMLRRVDK